VSNKSLYLFRVSSFWNISNLVAFNVSSNLVLFAIKACSVSLIFLSYADKMFCDIDSNSQAGNHTQPCHAAAAAILACLPAIFLLLAALASNSLLLSTSALSASVSILHNLSSASFILALVFSFCLDNSSASFFAASSAIRFFSS
jgi:hypothetical protein